MKLHLPPSFDGRHLLSVVPTKTDIILINILVASLYFLDELALGTMGIAHERPITHIVGESGKEKAVFAVGAEQFAELAEVPAEQGIGLLSGEWKTEMFTGLDAVAISDIGIILGLV